VLVEVLDPEFVKVSEVDKEAEEKVSSAGVVSVSDSVNV
jgi:hypothetical protein